MEKAVVTCALTGVLDRPRRLSGAGDAARKWRARRGAPSTKARASSMSISAISSRARAICPRGRRRSRPPSIAAIRDACPGVIVNQTTGVVGPGHCRARSPACAPSGPRSRRSTPARSIILRPAPTGPGPGRRCCSTIRSRRSRRFFSRRCANARSSRSSNVSTPASCARPRRLRATAATRARPNIISSWASNPACPPIRSCCRSCSGSIVAGARWSVTAIGRKEIWPLHRARRRARRRSAHRPRGYDLSARRLARRLQRRARRGAGRRSPATPAAPSPRPTRRARALGLSSPTKEVAAMTAHSFDAVRASPFYTPEHEAFRQTLRKFVAREIEPYANQWDEAGEFPRELYKKAAAIGYMRLGFPERYGGTECDRFMRIIAMQEIARGGSRRRRRRPLQPHDRRAADPSSRLGGDEGARAAANPVGRENLGARHHRAERRLRRRQPAHDRAARRRSFRHQRLQDLHHLGHARRLHHARRAHRRPRRERRQPDPGRGQSRGPAAHAAEEDGLVVLGHRDALFRERAACPPPTSSARRARGSAPSCSISTTSACTARPARSPPPASVWRRRSPTPRSA